MENIDTSAHVESSKGRAFVQKALFSIDMLARLDGWLGALCLCLLCLLMIAGIVVRTLSTVVSWLPKDIPIAWEYSSYLMAVTFTFGAALTLRAGGHIRVRVLLSNASPRVVKGLECVSAAAGFAFAAFFSVAMTHFSYQAFLTDERSLASSTPLWIPKAFVAFGAMLLALQLLARLGQLFLDEPVEDKNLIH
ncbi:TRAP transporter small permease subunit [Caballeronia sp. LP006]|jgi:TRAP-type C4-dicarboxylate transport system permease small subunit|uniref:TRAP transporter small permease subunit n=1 Tax=unclassified Caballeronia TaxID=2646786 RepID=UPI0020285670|nr:MULTISPECIES: TRAP transporter small permease subunit [unclassified Caballeronia]MDR5773193.1 TRAP transporter small permease subunit [Caballeronia sp. LZ002]MDR5800214.1 TRAP transporter small permease subunit [Caballeronia sp. LZ001]MDR5827674.1 TRAP transporter small permease subunit [Caballeronia sp. LP006]MDR5848627.1 TRAP transporter small permease subunit [Caballeronia sp. LZ003]